MNLVLRRFLMFGMCTLFLDASVRAPQARDFDPRENISSGELCPQTTGKWTKTFLFGGLLAAAGGIGSWIWLRRPSQSQVPEPTRENRSLQANPSNPSNPSSPVYAAGDVRLEPVREVGSNGVVTAFLANPIIHREIQELVDIAKNRGYLEALGDTNNWWKFNDPNWIETLFRGLSENEIVERLKQLPAPRQITLGEIDRECQLVKRAPAISCIDAKNQFVVVNGLTILDLHRSSLGICDENGVAICQLASQFDFLESPEPRAIYPVQELPANDWTQGPMGVCEAVTSVLHRKAAVLSGKLPHMLQRILPQNSEGYYKQGYFEPAKIPDSEKAGLLQSLKSNVSNMLTTPQLVLNDEDGHMQWHVPCAAPSFQDFIQPSISSVEGQLCKELVVPQYKSIAQLAVLQSRQDPSKPVKLHLTLVGQGSFNNPSEIVSDCFAAVAREVKGENVQVFIHGYNDSPGRDVEKIGKALQSIGVKAKRLDCPGHRRDNFANLTLEQIPSLPGFE